MRERIREEALNLKRCVHGGNSTDDIIDFSASINPLAPPDATDIVLAAYKRIGHYPDDRYTAFREAAANFVGVSANNIIPGNGSTEIIRLFAETVIERGDWVTIPCPTFGEYEFQSRLFGARPRFIEYEKVKNGQISDSVLKGSKALCICNPNNPTGDLLPRDVLTDLATRCSKNKIFLFVDEAFIELSDPEQSIADVAAENDFVFVLRSLTKCFAVPGIRIGYGIGSVRLVELLDRARLQWNLNIFADVIGVHLLKNPEYLERSRELIKTEREWLINRLSSIIGIRPLQSKANFILLDISGTDLTSREITQRMLEHGIQVRDCSSFRSLGETHVRVAVKTRAENEGLATAFNHALEHDHLGCEYYPCHFEGQDCTFCFCPFYSCEDERPGKFTKKSSGGVAWSCINCNIIHQPDVAQEVLDRLLAGDELSKVWKIIERRLCTG
ncbi:MAG: aminotransferase class I/II-fold pyridoxal phosphate-dependent enzyme [Methanosarcinales archaeon Met12]|nr:MAG: aminotransferase class I/II-fold pyridoxal phosphate-dependent enzyme [Methanosarcinales archaeon Met12]